MKRLGMMALEVAFACLALIAWSLFGVAVLIGAIITGPFIAFDALRRWEASR